MHIANTRRRSHAGLESLAAEEGKSMSLSNIPNSEQPKRADIPGWLAVIVALFFWIILLPLVHGGIPWAISLLTPRYGWTDGRPATWNLLGLIPVLLATICLIWLMILHFSRIPRRVKLERTPTYLLTRGPYRVSRNPMYVAELALWLGWAILYGSIPVFVAFLIMGSVMNSRVVPREERDLETRFGEVYREYKNRVPRWLTLWH
jgi:protein-S-isoprenylcysteine O-methyltransferase Ste14